MYLQTYINITSLSAWWVECSLMALETDVQSQVKSDQRHTRWYLILPCFIISITKYVSRVKWSSPERGVLLGVVTIKKGAFGLPLTTVAGFTYVYIYVYIYREREWKRKINKAVSNCNIGYEITSVLSYMYVHLVIY